MSSHSSTVDAVVLRTYDVGEADRFCVLFTRERGRVMARASAARRPGSRLGPLLLPLSRLSVQLKPSAGGWVIAGTALPAEDGTSAGELSGGDRTVEAFLRATEGVELLLRLIHDEEPLHDVFDATIGFLRMCAMDAHASIHFTFRLLHLLGLLPETEELRSLVRLSPEEIAFIDAARVGKSVPVSSAMNGVRRLKDLLLRDHLSSPLKAPGVALAMEFRGPPTTYRDRRTSE